MRQTLAATAAAVALLCSGALAGCVAIPTSGPIERGDDAPVEEPGLAVPQANAPEPDDSPSEIVNGFLTAGAAGLADEFTVARQFLTFGASADWQPRTVLIHAQGGGLDVQERADGTVLVTVPVQGKVDESFVYTEVAPGGREELVFEVTQDAAGQWRIAQLDGVVVMSPSNFEILYRRLPVYFASPDLTHLIPDLRWLPNQNAATHAVDALLDGPSPWLRDGVRTGVPGGAQLHTGAVNVSTELQAVVNLSPDASVASPTDDINLLQAQLDATLLRLPGVTSVAVQKGGLPWLPSRLPTMERDVSPQTGPYVLMGDRLAVVDGGTPVALPDAAPLTGLDANNPAISLDETIRVVLSGRNRLMLLPLGSGEPVALATGIDLLAPSVDRFGWIWTGERNSAGGLLAVQPTGEVAQVTAEFLQGRTVLSMRVARDGARIAVVHASTTDPADVVVDIAAIVRDGLPIGRPLQLGETPLQVGAVLDGASEVAWVDEVTVAVLGISGNVSVPRLHLVSLGGPTEALPLMDRTASIAAGGERAIYLADEDEVLLSTRSSSGWVVVAQGVRDPVFPG